jgi:hypothetical protein
MQAGRRNDRVKKFRVLIAARQREISVCVCMYVHKEDDEKAVKEAQQQAARSKQMRRGRRREKHASSSQAESEISLQTILKRKPRSAMEAPDRERTRRLVTDARVRAVLLGVCVCVCMRVCAKSSFSPSCLRARRHLKTNT